MRLHLPVKETAWGPITNEADFKALVRQRGQLFGVDESGPACNVNPTFPCDKTYYQYLGFGLHKGIDIPVATGTPVYAATRGKVTRVSDDVTQGIGIVIYDALQSIETVYWHLKSHSVMPGDMVEAGQQIAISDNTGYSEGPHLHFQVNLTNEHGKSGEAVDPINSFVWDTDMLTKGQVQDLQALEGYKDQTGVDYWGDGTKTLDQYLTARLQDKIKQEQDALNHPNT